MYRFVQLPDNGCCVVFINCLSENLRIDSGFLSHFFNRIADKTVVRLAFFGHKFLFSRVIVERIQTNLFIENQETLRFVLGQGNFTDCLVRVVLSDETFSAVIDNKGAAVEHRRLVIDVFRIQCKAVSRFDIGDVSNVSAVFLSHTDAVTGCTETGNSGCVLGSRGILG